MSSGGKYDDQHVEFVSSEKGTSAVEIVHILISMSLLPFLTSLLIPWIVPGTFSGEILRSDQLRTLVRASIEYPIIGVLPLFLITLCAGTDAEWETEGQVQLSYLIPLVLFLSALRLGYTKVPSKIFQVFSYYD